VEPSPPQPTANWSPDLDCWTEYDADEGSLFSVQPAVWSETWPTSGMTRDGSLYLRPAWVPPTSGSASSSWPTSEATTLLPTPEAKLSDAGPDYARADRVGSGGDDLNTTVHRHLLPTPRATDGTKGGPNQRGSSGDLMLPSAVQELLPTPKARDYKSAEGPSSALRNDPDLSALPSLLPTPRATRGGSNTESVDLLPTLLPTPTTDPASHNGHARNLGQESLLLPTPNGFHMTNHETPEQWIARRAEVEERTGTRHGPPLEVVTLSDAEGRPLVQDGQGPELTDPGTNRWGRYAGAVDRWARITHPAPEPTEPGAKGRPRLAARFVEWMMGLRPGHVTDVPGITRNDMLKALGNGVVPQQATTALRHMLTWST
jgi:hypothetical protein